MRTVQVMVGTREGGWSFLYLDLPGHRYFLLFGELFVKVVKAGHIPEGCVMADSMTHAGQVMVAIPPSPKAAKGIEELATQCEAQLRLQWQRTTMSDAAYFNASLLTAVAKRLGGH